MSHLEDVASEVLSQFENIATAARKRRDDSRVVGPSALASINTLNSNSAVMSLRDIDTSERESCRHLADEPAIARVLVEDDDGNQRTYYICRVTPVSGISNLTGYYTPIGRLASLPVGSTYRLPNGVSVEVLERAQLHPIPQAEEWDSKDTIVELEGARPVTVASLRALLTKIAGEEDAADIVSQILAQESLNDNVAEGVRRSVIKKMELRDQPVLDQYQDEIFRLPMDKRLFILGPPGTGKTTTLIRRLGQKLHPEFLTEEERRLVEGGTTTHASSWLMFTPTELLRQYLKEAFAREGIPASNLHIQTWRDYQLELAKSTFGILRSATGGFFVLRDAHPTLRPGTEDRLIELFADFDAWERSTYLSGLMDAAGLLAKSPLAEGRTWGARFEASLAKESDLVALLEGLAAHAPNLQTFVAGLKKASDEKIQRSLNVIMNRDKRFLDDLSRYIDGLQQAQASEPDDLDDVEAEDDEESNLPRGRAAATITAYMQAVRAYARAEAAGRPLNKASRNGKIIEWLGERILSKADRAQVGESLLVQTSARHFVNPVKRYLDGISKRYRAFRRVRQDNGAWYVNEGFKPRDIHPLELDVLLLAVIRAAGSLATKKNELRDTSDPAWTVLEPMLRLYRNQILVDEATDFSAIQMGCMAGLADPRIRSFFACGDFNQRLTTWGARSADDVRWVFQDLEIKEVTVSYRQSEQLNDLARAIILAVGGSEQAVTLPDYVENKGVAPALLEMAGDANVRIGWLADRILEIERQLDQLPSTAIFVNGEDEVGLVATQLGEVLADHNIQVVACPQGKVMGQDSDVRIFDIQYIKGLEFEAAFFMSVDRLAEMHPTLFDKYLYVGTTRAATYLGITCDMTLPTRIDSLRSRFVSDWQSFGTDE